MVVLPKVSPYELRLDTKAGPYGEPKRKEKHHIRFRFGLNGNFPAPYFSQNLKSPKRREDVFVNFYGFPIMKYVFAAAREVTKTSRKNTSRCHNHTLCVSDSVS